MFASYRHLKCGLMKYKALAQNSSHHPLITEDLRKTLITLLKLSHTSLLAVTMLDLRTFTLQRDVMWRWCLHTNSKIIMWRKTGTAEEKKEIKVSRSTKDIPMTSYSRSQGPTCVSNKNSVLVKHSSPMGYYALPWAYTRNIRRTTQRKITEDLNCKLYRFKEIQISLHFSSLAITYFLSSTLSVATQN
jgi:hypothetical protein